MKCAFVSTRITVICVIIIIIIKTKSPSEIGITVEQDDASCHIIQFTDSYSHRVKNRHACENLES